MSESIPSEIIIDTDKKARGVIVTPEVQQALPEAADAFVQVDAVFVEDPEAYLERLNESFFTIKDESGPEIPCSLLYDESSKKDEILIVFAAFNDGAPKSDPNNLYAYITKSINEEPSVLDKQEALPGTWNQITKSSTIFELLKAIGEGMPVLTIYSPIPTSAYGLGERRSIRKGDFAPAGRIAQMAVREAQQRLHGLRTETQIDKVNIQGASLGASNAIGAGNALARQGNTSIPSITAQELILGPANVIPDLLKRFTISGQVGEPSDVQSRDSYSPKIYEPKIRQAIDRYGSEPSMYARMANAARPTYMKGLTHPEQTVRSIENLLDNNVSLLVALAENSGLTHQTKDYLPNDKEKVVSVRAEKGQYADHLIDEHVALTGIIAALNVKNRN